MAKYEILLLGDGSHLFRTMAWVLEYKGYAVRTAIGPETALEALVKKNYDLVIAKLSMAEADGVDLLKRARRLNPEVKIMVVSGNHEVTFPQEAYEIEVDDYILMPISPTELWRRVSQCLESLEIVDLVPARLNPVKTAAEVNEQVLDRLMMMFHDLRGSMVSTSASLKLLVRGRYGEMGENALGKLHEVSDNVDKLILLTEEFMGKTFCRRRRRLHGKGDAGPASGRGRPGPGGTGGGTAQPPDNPGQSPQPAGRRSHSGEGQQGVAPQRLPQSGQ